MDTKLGNVLTYSERLPPLKPHDCLIKWPTRVHVAVWKFFISTFLRLMATGVFLDFEIDVDNDLTGHLTAFAKLIPIKI